MKNKYFYSLFYVIFGALTLSSCCKEPINQTTNHNETYNDSIPGTACTPTKGVKEVHFFNMGDGPSISIYLVGDDCDGITSELKIDNSKNYDSINITLDDKLVERIYSLPWENQYNITELEIGQHTYKAIGFTHYMGRTISTETKYTFEVKDLNEEPCIPTKEIDYSKEVIDNATTHIDVKIQGNDCEGIQSNLYFDYNSNDFEYWEVFLDNQSIYQWEHEVQVITFNHTELAIGNHAFRFELHHGGISTSYECTFTIMALE